MICEWCGTVFCWDDADETALGCGRKQFCSRSCAKRASAARTGLRQRDRARQRERAACRRHGKVPYENEAVATKAAGAIFSEFGWNLRPYECSCGSWHLTSQASALREQGKALKRALFGVP